MTRRYKTFKEFWPFYVSQHLNRTNRRLHFIGTSLALLIMGHWLWVVAQIFWISGFGDIWAVVVTVTHLMLALPSGYGPAWMGHFFFEKNRPATFKYPFWSLRGDFKMYFRMWQKRMDGEIWLVQTEHAFATRTNERKNDVYRRP